MNQIHFEHNSNYSGFDQPPQYSINHQEDLNQQRISDVHVIWDKLEESNNEILNMVRSFCEMVIQRKQAANISTHTLEPSRHFNFTCDDDDDDEPEDSLITGNEELSTIPKKESDEFIKSRLRTLFQSQESLRIHPVVIVIAFYLRVMISFPFLRKNP
ncbi:hypothetical protein Tco_1288262 [Tanacetum coccineum]